MLQQNFHFQNWRSKVNTLIFPNLESGNSTYKLRIAWYRSIGPIMMGMEKPCHILQLGASVD
jgi:malate dehydrogenase (oxaloacetate-decarboxylating)(NADP+)